MVINNKFLLIIFMNYVIPRGKGERCPQKKSAQTWVYSSGIFQSKKCFYSEFVNFNFNFFFKYTKRKGQTIIGKCFSLREAQG